LEATVYKLYPKDFYYVISATSSSEYDSSLMQTLAASKSLGSWLVALLPCQAMTLQHLRTKVLQETDFKLLRCNGLLIYGIVNKIERALVITKQIFHYYNSNFSLICHKRGKRWSKMYIYTQTDPQPPDEGIVGHRKWS